MSLNMVYPLMLQKPNGNSYLEPVPKCSLNDCELQLCDDIEYLGAILSNSQKPHVDKRLRACRQAFLTCRVLVLV